MRFVGARTQPHNVVRTLGVYPLRLQTCGGVGVYKIQSQVFAKKSEDFTASTKTLALGSFC